MFKFSSVYCTAQMHHIIGIISHIPFRSQYGLKAPSPQRYLSCLVDPQKSKVLPKYYKDHKSPRKVAPLQEYVPDEQCDTRSDFAEF